MKAKKCKPQNILISRLRDIKSKIQDALRFYRKLEDTIPASEHWKIQQTSSFWPTLGGLLSSDVMSPVKILDTALSTVDYYIQTLDIMTPDQLAAFYLGLGIDWLEISYWGMPNALKALEKVDKGLKFYRRLEEDISDNEMWKIKKRDDRIPLERLVPPSEKLPSEILAEFRELLVSQIEALEFWVMPETSLESRKTGNKEGKEKV
jgi:hypothetical protein